MAYEADARGERWAIDYRTRAFVQLGERRGYHLQPTQNRGLWCRSLVGRLAFANDWQHRFSCPILPAIGRPLVSLLRSTRAPVAPSVPLAAARTDAQPT